MSRDTYLALIEAVQEHIQDVTGDDQYARDWVLVAGVEAMRGAKDGQTEIRLERSPRTTAYSVTGLLTFALDCYYSE